MRTLLALLMAFLIISPARADDAIDKGVRDAFLFAFPVYQMSRTRAEAVANAQAGGRTIVNRFGHRARLAGPTDRLVTTPNNDTLYSSSWLDLSATPVILTIPALPDRYHSVALMNIFTDNFAVLGTRANAGRGGTFFITGPNWRGRVPVGMQRVRAPTNDVWALGRILVDSPTDLAAASQDQTRFTLAPFIQPTTQSSIDAPPPRQPSAQIMLEEVNKMLGRGPLPADRARIAARLARFGIKPGVDTWESLEPAVRDSWTRNLSALTSELRGGFASVGIERQGWSYPRPGMGQFGNDEFYRAAVALGGLAALPPEEAIYLTATRDDRGQALIGSRNYTLTLPKDVPVSAFWSLSMYEVAEDGRLFFTANPINRYAIGNRTPDLVRNEDGSLTITLQNHAPTDPKANWLPTPSGAFRMTFRGYLPDRNFLAGRFSLPGVAAQSR